MYNANVINIYTFFIYKQLVSGLMPRSCLYFQCFWSSKQFVIQGLVAYKLVLIKKKEQHLIHKNFDYGG